MGSYTTLLTDIPSYMMNANEEVTAAVPTFISNAEARLYRDLNIPALEGVTTGSLSSASAYLTFPTDLIAARTFSIQISAAWVPLVLVNAGLIRMLYPSLSTQGTPGFYAVYDATRYVFGPAPSTNAPYELLYRKRLAALSTTNTTNWISENFYDGLLAACMCEAAAFVQDDRQESLTKLWEQKYRNDLTAANAQATVGAKDNYAIPFGSPEA